MTRFGFTALCLCFCFTGSVSGTTIINKCDEPVYAAYLGLEVVGFDGLGGDGATVRIKTTGWYKVGARDEAESVKGYSHILVMKNGAVISSLDRNAPGVKGGCLHRSKSFSRSIVDYDNRNREPEANHPVSECFFEPGVVQLEGVVPEYRWLPFQQMPSGSFTVRFDTCKPDANPTRTRFTWKPADFAKNAFLYSWYDKGFYSVVSMKYGGRDREKRYWVTKEYEKGLVLKEQGNLNLSLQTIALGLKERKILTDENKWAFNGEGGWIE